MMRIYIPTFRRPHSQLSFKRLPENWQDRVWFVVHESEWEEFRWHPRLVIIPKDLIGAPIFRQHAVEHAHAQGCSKIFMIDDDIAFVRRVDDWDYDTNAKLEMATPEQVGEALDRAERDLDTYAAVGFSARGFNNGSRWHPTREGYRMMMAFGVRVDTLTEEGIRFDEFPFWEDFHVTLELFYRGFPNLIYMDFCHQAPTNKFGGVSTYRTRERLLACREKFLARHAPYATPTDKSAEEWGEGMGGDGATVPDLKVNWKRALDDAKYVLGDYQ